MKPASTSCAIAEAMVKEAMPKGFMSESFGKVDGKPTAPATGVAFGNRNCNVAVPTMDVL